MNILKIIGIFFLLSCENRTDKSIGEFSRILPDTSKSWSGKRTREVYLSTRILEEKLRLENIYNGVGMFEMRIWNIPSSYDPAGILILTKLNEHQWRLRSISFYRFKNDSITSDKSKLIHGTTIKGFQENRYWNLLSQSDMKDGDSFGCVDGSSLFVEIADNSRYKILWYNCPFINRDKDSSFKFISELPGILNSID